MSRGRARGEVTMSVECRSIDSELGRNAREVGHSDSRKLDDKILYEICLLRRLGRMA
jgi:hypothetical protein